MNEIDSEKPYLRLREIFNEILLRDIVLFSLLFLFTLAQEWDSILLFLFPIINFAYSLAFKILSTNKWRMMKENSPIVYNPLGYEKRHANRFMFTSLLQLILLFWIGAESLYHPQLIDNYNIYFNIIFFFIYSFSFYWIMIDIWKYSKIEIIFNNFETQKNNIDTWNELISCLKFKKFRQISLINLITFIGLNVLNILLSLLIFNNPILGLFLDLPGTVLYSSIQLQIPLSCFFILGMSPIITTIFLTIIYKEITNFTLENVNQKLNKIPDDVKKEILTNLKKITNNLESTE